MEIPEEVVIAIEGEDRATPTFRQVGRSFVLLGANLAYLTRELGIQSPLINTIAQASLTLGHAMRLVTAAQSIYNMVASLTAPIQAAQAASSAAVAVSGYTASQAMAVQAGMNYVFTGSAVAATTANIGLAASFHALFISMGPIGWALMGISAVLGVVSGYALAGGFGAKGPTAVPTVGKGPFREPTTQITVNVANMSVRKDVEEITDEMASLWHRKRRKYGAE